MVVVRKDIWEELERLQGMDPQELVRALQGLMKTSAKQLAQQAALVRALEERAALAERLLATGHPEGEFWADQRQFLLEQAKLQRSRHQGAPRIPLQLGAMEILLLFRLLWEEGYLQLGQKAELFRFIAEQLLPASGQPLSQESLRKKYSTCHRDKSLQRLHILFTKLLKRIQAYGDPV